MLGWIGRALAREFVSRQGLWRLFHAQTTGSKLIRLVMPLPPLTPPPPLQALDQFEEAEARKDSQLVRQQARAQKAQKAAAKKAAGKGKGKRNQWSDDSEEELSDSEGGLGGGGLRSVPAGLDQGSPCMRGTWMAVLPRAFLELCSLPPPAVLLSPASRRG